MKSKLTIILLLLISCLLHASTGPIDSLLSILHTSKHSEESVLLYCEIASEYRRDNLDSAFQYAFEGYTLAKEIEFSNGIAESASTLARLYVTDNNLEKAREFYTEAEDEYAKAGNVFKQTQSRMRLGNIQLAQSQYFEALQLYESCLPISEENNYVDILPHLYNNTGVIFMELQDYDEAVFYFKKAAIIFESIDETYSLSLVSNNLAYIYSQQGDVERSLDTYISIVPIYIKHENWAELSNLYAAIANIYKEQGNIKKASEHIVMAMSILENNSGYTEGPSSRIEARVYYSAAQLEFINGNHIASASLSKRSINLALANSYQAYIINNARLLSDNYYALGRTDSALYFSRLFAQYQDSLDNSKGINEVAQLRMQGDFDAKLRAAELKSLQENAALRYRQTLLIAFSIGAFMLLSIMILLIKNLRKKANESRLRRENMELSQAKLQHQVDYKNKELTLNMMYMTEKNEFITMIAKKLEGMKTDAKRENRLVIQQIINELKKNSGNKSWKEFEVRFMEVHADFYNALNKAFPDLTPNEKRLCAFLRLNMTTKEISSMTYQSTQSINMARFRLRKKMNMERDENLISYLTGL